MTAHSGVPFSTQVDKSIMHWLLVTVGLRFWAPVVPLLRRLMKGAVSFYVFVSLLALMIFQSAFWRLPTGYFVKTDWERLRGDFVSLIKVCPYQSAPLVEHGILFLSFHFCIHFFASHKFQLALRSRSRPATSSTIALPVKWCQKASHRWLIAFFKLLCYVAHLNLHHQRLHEYWLAADSCFG